MTTLRIMTIGEYPVELDELDDGRYAVTIPPGQPTKICTWGSEEYIPPINAFSVVVVHAVLPPLI
jgi:hypothetical protein